MLRSQFNPFECFASQVWPLEVIVVLNAFYRKDRLFEYIPRATPECSKMRAVDNHITHTTAPCAGLSPIHPLWNVLILLFVLFFSPYLPWFLVFTVILIGAELICVDQPLLFLYHFKNRLTFSRLHNSLLIYSPTDLVLSVERCVLCTCSLCSPPKPSRLHQLFRQHSFSPGLSVFLYN